MLIAKFAIILLWLGAVIDPIGNMFGIRYAALTAALSGITWMVATGRIRGIEKSYRGFIILLMAVILPLYGLLLYSFRASNQEFVDTSYLGSGVLIITSLLYRDRNMCNIGVKSLILSARLLSFVVLAGYISQIVGFDDFIGFFTERNVAIVSFREYAGFSLPYIYFLASPLLILLLAHDFELFLSKRTILGFIAFFVTTFSFALTGTRAHILIAILFAPTYMLLKSTPKTIIKSIFLFVGIAIIAATQQEVRSLFDSFTSTTETSNSMKLSLLDGYIEIFYNPFDLLLGQGFNAHEWSPPLREMINMEEKASRTELTYIELVRVFGVGFASIFILTLFGILRARQDVPEKFHWIYRGFAIYLINAAINPYLFSVNGILPLGLIASLAYYYRKIGHQPQDSVRPSNQGGIKVSDESNSRI